MLQYDTYGKLIGSRDDNDTVAPLESTPHTYVKKETAFTILNIMPLRSFWGGVLKRVISIGNASNWRVITYTYDYICFTKISCQNSIANS